jgi:hypothetical protein
MGASNKIKHGAARLYIFISAALQSKLCTRLEIKMPLSGALFYLAEREGFEPPEAFTSTVFKTAALNRSAISPAQK